MLQNHVISLTTAHERRTHITNEFAKHNIPFDFFDAVTPGDRLNQVITQFATVYQLNPGICVQEMLIQKNHSRLGSDIEKERSSNRKQNKDKLNPLAKLLREIKKIPDAIRKLNYQEIPFK